MKVLLVEDDPLLGELFAFSLRDAHFDVIHVTTGEDALLQCANTPINIVLLDIILPGINGFDVLTKMKSNDKTKNIPIIVISNLGDQANIDHAIELGAVHYFVKSNVLPRDIIAKVNEVLDVKA